jgi:predicted nuclease of predicted toxin-antitoxin system
MKILIDMNLSPTWIEFLVASGFEAAHWSQVGSGDAHDTEVMRWAAEHDHVVLAPEQPSSPRSGWQTGNGPKALWWRSMRLARDCASCR